jgi:hypothetical protein
VHRLHDWHTHTTGLIQGIDSSKHLNVCFVEGDADLSHVTWPSDSKFLDLLVSHTGSDRTAGLHPGDRLLAVDGMHPVAWARTLIKVDWGYWQADDDRVNAEFAERMRDLIPLFAQTLTVQRCDAAAGTCAGPVQVLSVADLVDDPSDAAPMVQCDNRPGYHLAEGNPDVETHWIDGLYRGRLADSKPAEELYGMTWDSLYGPSLTAPLRQANSDFLASARGVILDHRAGNGGTIDAAEAVTELARKPLDLAIPMYERPYAGFEGPDTADEGLAIFKRYSAFFFMPDLTYTVGSSTANETLPVALLLHRDGSASDYMPFGMKGAPKVRIFGPHPTAGAFSSFFNLNYWGSFAVQLASGDTITNSGQALIGHGVEPDEVVLPRQSDLLRGRDTIYERALGWVRSELAK